MIDLIHKYSLRHLPELTKKPTPTFEQQSEKSPSDILKIKKEQAEKQKIPKYTIKCTDKAALEENPANHRLYHVLMEALIEDENAMDKRFADTVKDHKRKHDDDEDGDDEGPPAGPNQGKKTKRRRTKESESIKKPSTTKETPKDKAPTKGSKTSKSASVKEPVEEPNAEVIRDDVGNDVVRDDDQPQAASEPKTYKTQNPKWFKQPPRPPTPDPEWNKRQIVLDQPEQLWSNQMVSDSQDPLTFNDLMATPIEFSKYVLNGLKIENLTQDILLGPALNLLKGTCSSSIELAYNFQECFNALNDKLDWNNPEGYRYPFNLSKPLPLYEVTYTSSITKIKAARYEIKGIDDIVPTLWSTINHAYDKDALIRIKHRGERLKLWYRSQYKECDFVDLHLNDIRDMLLLVVQHKLFHLEGSDIVDFIVALRTFISSLILKGRVEDLQLGVESYPKKLNITKPQKTFPGIEFKEPYTPSYDPLGIVYEDLNK
ncbi:hypothetical protein Tco_1261127 [Tanacetum coccineum]